MRWAAAISLSLMLVAAAPLEARDGQDIPALFRTLADSADAGHAEARDALVPLLLFELPRGVRLPEAAQPTLANVRAALASSDTVTRIVGAAAAARMGLRAKPLLDDLLGPFNRGVFAYDIHVLEVLRGLGPDAAEAAPALARAFARYADWSLGRFEPGSPIKPGRDVGSAARAAMHAIGPAGYKALAQHVRSASYVRPITQALLAELRTRFDPPAPPEPTAPTESERGEPPIAAPVVWLARIEAEIIKYGIPGERRVPTSPDERPWQSVESLFALGERGVPALIYVIGTGSPKARRIGLDVLAALGTSARAAGEAVFAIVKSGDLDLRTNAVHALGRGGAVRAEWLDTLLPLVEGADLRTRIGAVRTLGRMGPAAAAARPALLEILATELDTSSHAGVLAHDAVRLLDAAIRAVAQVGGEPGVLAPALLVAGAGDVRWRPPGFPRGGYRGPSWLRPTERTAIHVRNTAAQALGQLGPGALPFVRKALVDERAALRAAAARALSAFPASEVRESAIHASRDKDPLVRRIAIDALARLGGASAVRALHARLDDPDEQVVATAIGALAKLRHDAEGAAARLAEMVIAGGPPARRALEALDAIRPDATRLHAPTLAKALGAGTLSARDTRWRLEQMGAVGPAVAPTLLAVLPDLDERDQLMLLPYLARHAPKTEGLTRIVSELGTSGSVPLRLASVQTLAVLRLAAPDPGTVIDALAARLSDPDADVAVAAASGLERPGPGADRARAALRAVLAHEMAMVRAQAVLAVGRGPDAQTARPAALALLSADDGVARRAAVKAIAAIGNVVEALPRLKQMLESEPVFGVRLELLPAIASTGPEGIAEVHRFMRVVRKDRTRWLRARNALGHGRAHIVPELRRWLGSSDLSTYIAATSMLRDMGAPARPAVPELLVLARSGKQQALLGATEALAALLGPDERVHSLVASCLRKDDLCRNMASRLLRRMGPDATHVLPALDDALPFLRGAAIHATVDALASYGQGAVSVTTSLLASLPGAAGHERAKLLEALPSLAKHVVLPPRAFIWALQDPDPLVRRAAASVTAQCAPGDAALIERIGALLDDPDASVRLAAADALATLGADAKPASPALLRATERAETPVMRVSMRALQALEPASDVLRPVLYRLAEGSDAWRASAALEALGHAKGAQPEIDALLERLLRSWDWRIRYGAQAGRTARAPR